MTPGSKAGPRCTTSSTTCTSSTIHELPTLQPWMNASSGKKIRHNFRAQPLLPPHRQQRRATALYRRGRDGDCGPRSGRGQIQRGRSDLQGRGLDFRDASILKKGEGRRGLQNAAVEDRGCLADRNLSQPELSPMMSGARPCAMCACAARCRWQLTARPSIRRFISSWPSPARCPCCLPRPFFSDEENARRLGAV